VHVDDAAEAAVLALGWPAGAVNVADGEPAPGTAWVPAFCEAVGAPPPRRERRPRAAWARGAANERARTLGWTPRRGSWRSGFGEL
jgi:nucleoside-diphosphate-sugar epimerase